MMKNVMIVFALSLLLSAASVQATITCSGTDSSKTIALGETQAITVSCSGIGSSETVSVQGTYSSDCLSAEDSTEFSLTQDSPSSQISFEATSMSCQGNPDDRKITWSFDHETETISNAYTSVTITSPLSITASFNNAPYAATSGSSVTVILEVSTSATTDITDIDADMTATGVTGITDWNDNTIYSSGSQKTIQKSWTITAPATTGAYTITAFVTSQNADSDTASTTLTVSSSGGDSPGGGSSDDDTPGGTSGGLPDTNEDEEDATVTEDVVISVGEELVSNAEVATAVETLLGEMLTDEVKEALTDISAEITQDFSATRTFDASSGTTSKITTEMTYNGDKKVKNFMLFESVPKSFAESATLVTVTAAGGTVQVAEDDPSWVILFPEVTPGQKLSVDYVVDGEKNSSVMDEMNAEVYATSVEEIATEQPETTTTPTTTTPSGLALDSGMLLMAVAAVIVVIVIILAVVGIKKMKKGGGKPPTASAFETVKQDLGQ